jgi:hypothetical protein
MKIQMFHLLWLQALLLRSTDFTAQFKTNVACLLSEYSALIRECSHNKYIWLIRTGYFIQLHLKCNICVLQIHIHILQTKIIFLKTLKSD